MNCSDIREKLGFYIDKELDEQNLEMLEEHLRSSCDCRRELAALKLLVRTAGEIEDIEPPADMKLRIASAVSEVAYEEKAASGNYFVFPPVHAGNAGQAD